MPEKIILAISYLFLLVAIFIAIKNNYQEMNKLVDDLNDSLSRELDWLSTKAKLMEIMIYSKTNNEKYYITLEKIERELFNK